MSRWFFALAFFLPRACLAPPPADAVSGPGPSFEAGTIPVASDPAPVDGSAAMPLDAACSVPSSESWVPVSHLPGTLLRDAGGRFWVVARWPDRRELLPGLFDDPAYRRDRALPLSAEEALCLRPSLTPWLPSRLWSLRRLPDGSLWFVNEPERYRRLARPAVLRARNQDPASSTPLGLDPDAFAERYRDLGPMPPPDGALFLVDGVFVFVSEGKRRPFADPGLVRAVGYDPEWAMPISAADLDDLAAPGEPLTRATFRVCPLAAAQLRETEDRDGDGVPFFRDCDDEDSARHPGHVELCDGVDNDCDLVVDNGFDVGHRCLMDDACRSPAYRRCAVDRLHTECWDDEVVCPR